MNAPHQLGQLIQSVEDSRGWSLREVARRIERTGRTMSHAYVARLKREPITSVTYETIQAMALGLDLPERVVATAALESMGVHDIGSAESGAAVAIARDPDLSERDRRILLAVVREMQGEHLEKSTSAEPAAGGHVEDQAEPDGVTTGELAGAAADAAVPDRPWEKDEFALAAKRGRNIGAEIRRRQDAEAEASQDREE